MKNKTIIIISIFLFIGLALPHFFTITETPYSSIPSIIGIAFGILIADIIVVFGGKFIKSEIEDWKRIKDKENEKKHS